jgi:hypothetical protein
MKTRAFTAAACSALLLSTFALADTFNVNVNTTPIAGESGYLAFDLTGGSPVENNVVSISTFASNSSLGVLSLTGAASGTISPGPGSLNDSQFFNELLQEVTFGSTLSFTLSLSTNYTSGSIPDTFAFYLLDSTSNPFTTSDPTGANSLFAINIDAASLTPDVYSSSSATATLSPLSVAATPEPASFWLMLASVPGLLFSLWFRSRHLKDSHGGFEMALLHLQGACDLIGLASDGLDEQDNTAGAAQTRLS